MKKILPLLILIIVKIWLKTLRVTLISPYDSQETAIFAFFHGQQFSLLTQVPKPSKAIISLSKDGDLQVEIMAGFGITAIRGSSSKGGVKALLQSKKALDQNQHILMAIDGPKGPVYQAKSGCAYLSQLSQKPIYLCHVFNQHRYTLKTWDRFELPLPFSRVLISFERLASQGTIEELRMEIETKLREKLIQNGKY